jgi:hypothetical protein
VKERMQKPPFLPLNSGIMKASATYIANLNNYTEDI